MAQSQENSNPEVPGWKTGGGRAALVTTLIDSDSRVRFYAADTLGKIGPGARMAVSRLRKMMETESSLLLRHTAEEALKNILGEGE